MYMFDLMLVGVGDSIAAIVFDCFIRMIAHTVLGRAGQRTNNNSHIGVGLRQQTDGKALIDRRHT